MNITQTPFDIILILPNFIYHRIKICSNIYTLESLLELISVYPK